MSTPARQTAQGAFAEIGRVFALQQAHQWEMKATTAEERKEKLKKLKSAVEAHGDEIVAAVNALRARYTYLFTTGGIGPTHDDITVDAIAGALGVAVVEHPKARAVLEAYYASRGGLTEARLRMARDRHTSSPSSHSGGGFPGGALSGSGRLGAQGTSGAWGPVRTGRGPADSSRGGGLGTSGLPGAAGEGPWNADGEPMVVVTGVEISLSSTATERVAS